MPRQPKKPPGRKPEVLKIEGDWKEVIGRALRKGKPPAGPPKSKAKKKRKR